MASRRSLAVAFSLALVLAFAAPVRGAAPPPGPRLAVNVEHIYPNAGSEVRTMGPNGEAQRRIVGGPDSSSPAPIYGTAPAWSPDGSRLTFFGPAGRGPTSFLVDADGTHLLRLKSMEAPAGPRSFVQEPPIFEPRGDLVGVVFKLLRGHFERPADRFNPEGRPVVALALWDFPTNGSRPHPLTGFRRDRLVLPYSFAPDGTLLAEVATRGGSMIGTVDRHGGSPHTVIPDPRKVGEPTFSPDGSQIAYFQEKLGKANDLEEPRIRESDLMVVPATGGTPRLVIRVAGGARWPAWDPSGSRLSFTTLDHGSYAGVFKPHQGNALMEVNADGTCLTKVFDTARGVVYGAAWQPGADRGAGPISC
jgi:hypothetical protein